MKVIVVCFLFCAILTSRCHGRKMHSKNSIFDTSENAKYKLQNRHLFKLNVYEPENLPTDPGKNENYVHPTTQSEPSDYRTLSMEVGDHIVNVKSVLDSKKLSSAPKAGGYKIIVNPKFRHVIEIINKGMKHRKQFKDKDLEKFHGENTDSDDSTQTDFLDREQFMKTIDTLHQNQVIEDVINYNQFVGTNVESSEIITRPRDSLDPEESETEDISSQNQFAVINNKHATDVEQFAVTDDEVAADVEQFAVTDDEVAADVEQFAVTDDEVATDREQFAVTDDKVTTDREQFTVADDDVTTDREQFAVADDEVTTDREQFAVADDEVTTDRDQFAVADDEVTTDRDQFAVADDEVTTDRDQFAVTDDEVTTDRDQFAVTDDEVTTDRDQFAVTDDEVTTDRDQFAVTDDKVTTDREQFAVTDDEQFGVIDEEFVTDREQFVDTEDDHMNREQTDKTNRTDSDNEQLGRNFENSVFNSESEGSGEQFSEIENSGNEDGSKSGRLFGIFSRQNETAPICKTPKGEPGHCRRMRQCLVSDALEKFNNFLQQLCLIRGALVGMCCPDNPVVEITNPEENATQTLAADIKQPPEGCGLNHKTRIVGGSLAGPQEWTWMVALMRRNRFYCGGVIINNLYILTAAHCVMGIDVKDLTVRLGEYDFNTQSRHTEDISVAEIKRHAQFVTLTFQHDIALLKLRRTITYSKFVGSICLPSTKARDYSDVNGTVVGWGTVSFGGQASPILRQVTVPVWRNKDCDRTYLLENISDSFMCAGSPERGEDACQGDSGGPLMATNERGRWEVIGIVSWGRRCGDPTYPGVYTRVTTYLDWINQNIN